MNLIDYINSKVDLAPLVAAGSDGSIADYINNTLVDTYVPTEVGVGTVLETMGITNGNTFLDFIKSNTDFRFIWPLLEQGRLRLDSQLVLATLDFIVTNTTGILSAADAANLKSKAKKPMPEFGRTVSHSEVSAALRG